MQASPRKTAHFSAKKEKAIITEMLYLKTEMRFGVFDCRLLFFTHAH